MVMSLKTIRTLSSTLLSSTLPFFYLSLTLILFSLIGSVALYPSFLILATRSSALPIFLKN